MHGIADYTFLRPLGRGSHGTFYLAVTPPRLRLPAEHVAVKVLSGGTDEDAFRRTTRELRAFAAATSPHLVTLYDAGQQGGMFFYSMPYYPDGSLAEPRHPLSRERVLLAVAQAARAAHALHEAGLVHRSIKPENILLDGENARLSDLGLAQALTSGQTVTGLGPIGAVEYLEPAILLGGRGSRASDVWSLGVTLHRALTGHGVFGELPADDALVAVRTVLSTQPRMDPSLDQLTADVVRRCLAAAPADRPHDALALALELEALAVAPVEVRTPVPTP